MVQNNNKDNIETTLSGATLMKIIKIILRIVVIGYIALLIGLTGLFVSKKQKNDCSVYELVKMHFMH